MLSVSTISEYFHVVAVRLIIIRFVHDADFSMGFPRFLLRPEWSNLSLDIFRSINAMSMKITVKFYRENRAWRKFFNMVFTNVSDPVVMRFTHWDKQTMRGRLKTVFIPLAATSVSWVKSKTTIVLITRNIKRVLVSDTFHYFAPHSVYLGEGSEVVKKQSLVKVENQTFHLHVQSRFQNSLVLIDLKTPSVTAQKIGSLLKQRLNVRYLGTLKEVNISAAKCLCADPDALNVSWHFWQGKVALALPRSDNWKVDFE